jgi:hypothetical protein
MVLLVKVFAAIILIPVAILGTAYLAMLATVFLGHVAGSFARNREGGYHGS